MMARPLRLEFAGALYPVTSRGNALKSKRGQALQSWQRKGVAHLEGSGQEAQHHLHPALREWGSLWDDPVALLPPRLPD
jgi:hypothetical protein